MEVTRDRAQEKVTLDHVAAAVGVSRAAASLALRGLPGVSDRTRRRVVAAAADLGYESPSPLRSKTERSSVAVLIKSREGDHGRTNAFYGPVTAGITAECSAADLEVRMDSLPVDDASNPLGVPRLLREGSADGFIVLGAYITEATAALFSDVPVVLVDGYAHRPFSVASVVTDNTGGAYQATRHLIARGHRSVAFVGSTPTSFPSIRHRRDGYDQAMIEAGLEPWHVDAPHYEPDVSAGVIVDELVGDRRPTGVVASNDAVAISVMSGLIDRGLDLPRDMSIVGFDDIEAAALVRPRLDTVAVDKPAMGRLSVSLLRHRMENPSDPSFVVTQATRLIARDSVSPV